MDVNGTHLHLRLGQRDWANVIESASASPDRVLRWQTDQAPTSASFRPVYWDEDWRSVSLTRRVPRFRPTRGTRLLTADDRRGVCADAYGNVYWIGDDRARIRVQPGGLSAAGDYWTVTDLTASCSAERVGIFQPAETAAPIALPELRGLAVTTAHYLIVGTLRPAGLLLFDLHGSGAPCCPCPRP